MENALAHLHDAIDLIDRDIPDSDAKSRVEFSIKNGFQQELVAFLALHNILALANDPNLTKTLLEFSREAFEEWVTKMREEGSVTG